MSASPDFVGSQAQQQLLDRGAIEELLSRLALLLDDKRLDDLASIFVDDVVGEFPWERVDGIAALAAHGARDLVYERMQHVITNALIELDGPRARVRANLMAVHVPRADEPALHGDVGCVYHFDAVRTADGWRLAHVKLDPVWSAGAPLVEV